VIGPGARSAPAVAHAEQALADLLAGEVDVGPVANTAVTCEKPLRDSDRVRSGPGMPASAVSIGKVTWRSTSTGESEASRVLICTSGPVMSGTASIGSTHRARTPNSAAMSVATTTVQRRWIENSRMRFSMVTLSARRRRRPRRARP
jgi:hypothetical protein